MVKISLELKELTPALTSPILDKEVKIANENIHTILKKMEEKFYLITVNVKPEPISSVKITLPFEANKDKVKVLFENRSVSIENGVIVDDFKTYERHVYEM